jgi:Cu(I)/Ag(I) efflux system membrane fusion protein
VRVLIALILGLALVGCSKSETPGSVAAPAKYHCPMHPTVVSDKPGDCPICGMRLVPINEPEAEQAAAAAANPAPKKKIMYRSTMNPNEISDKPGKDSMGMEMVPFEVTESGKGNVPGLATISVTPEARERMGLTFGTVERRPLSRDVRTSAKIVADEKRLYKVTTKVEGWVDKLFVNVTGQAVKKGDLLLSIYSPDLVSAEGEYLNALHSGSTNLVAASKRRLQLWDISDAQIERIEKSGEAEKYLTLYAPADGWVTEKNVVAGQKVMPNDSLLVVADLTEVWGEADIYESDLPYVKVGMPLEIELPYWPDKVFKGEIDFLYPYLDPESRTLKARLDIKNPELLLKPQMYANARLSYRLGERLAVPDGAVMQTGEHIYAFRDGGNGSLVPVEIQIGVRSDGWYELISGLNEGDRVVTSANFLVDSESSMKAALAALAGK